MYYQHHKYLFTTYVNYNSCPELKKLERN